MSVGAIAGNTMPVNYGGNENKTNNVDEIFDAVKEKQPRAWDKCHDKILGLMTIPVSSRESIGVGAFYSNDSTEEDPVITVDVGPNEKYDIHVKEVDPSNANQFEMFALSCYLDDRGITERGSFGSFSRLRNAYLDISGFSIDYDSSQAARKTNWLEVLKQAKDTYFGNSETYAQGLEAEKLLEKLQEWKEKLLEKIINGETEEKIQTGADAYTEAEWDEIMENFDEVQEELREEIEERNAELEQTEEAIKISKEETAVRTKMLTSESLTAEDDNHELHIMWTTDEGIFCRKAGQTEGYEWSIPFNHAGQRNMVETLMHRLPKERIALATDVSIWERYLKGELSMNQILEKLG